MDLVKTFKKRKARMDLQMSKKKKKAKIISKGLLVGLKKMAKIILMKKKGLLVGLKFMAKIISKKKKGLLVGLEKMAKKTSKKKKGLLVGLNHPNPKVVRANRVIKKSKINKITETMNQKKKAVLIGLKHPDPNMNTIDVKGQLLRMKKHLMEQRGFPKDNITLIIDRDHNEEPVSEFNIPTDLNIRLWICNLIEFSRPGDILYIHLIAYGCTEGFIHTADNSHLPDSYFRAVIWRAKCISHCHLTIVSDCFIDKPDAVCTYPPSPPRDLSYEDQIQESANATDFIVSHPACRKRFCQFEYKVYLQTHLSPVELDAHDGVKKSCLPDTFSRVILLTSYQRDYTITTQSDEDNSSDSTLKDEDNSSDTIQKDEDDAAASEDTYSSSEYSYSDSQGDEDNSPDTTSKDEDNPGGTTSKDEDNSPHTIHKDEDNSPDTTSKDEDNPGGTTSKDEDNSPHTIHKDEDNSPHTTHKDEDNPGGTTSKDEDNSPHTIHKDEDNSPHTTHKDEDNFGDTSYDDSYPQPTVKYGFPLHVSELFFPPPEEASEYGGFTKVVLDIIEETEGQVTNLELALEARKRLGATPGLCCNDQTHAHASFVF